MANNSQIDIVSKLNLSKIKNEDSLMKYGESFQNNILKAFLLDHQFYLDVHELIDKTHFSKFQSYIFEQLNDYFSKYNRLPTKETLLIVLQDDKILEDNKKTISEIISDIYNLSNKINDIEYYEDKTLKFIRNSRVKNAIFNSIKLLQEEDYDAIVGEITSAVKEIDKNKNLSFNFFKNKHLLVDFIKRDVVPTPYDVINKICKGGLGLGELSVIQGGTSAGKSFLMQIISMMALINYNIDVVYYTLEMSERQVAERLISILLKKHIQDVTTKEVKDIDKIVLDHGITAQYHIKEFPSGEATINTLKNNCDNLRNQFDIKPKLIVVDYDELIRPITHRATKREELNDIYINLRGWSKQDIFAMLTAGQFNKSGWARQSPDITNSAESFSKNASIDFSILIGRSVEDRLYNTGRAIIGKNRNGKDSIAFPMKIDLDNGIIDIFDDIQPITNPEDFKEEFDNSDYISELINGNYP